jgi:hypothetical protein
MLSVILTASVLFPNITGTQILAVLIGGSALALVATLALLVWQRRRGPVREAKTMPLSERATWRMPPLAELPRAELTLLNLAFLTALRGYLFIAGGLVLVRIAQLISGGH